MWDMSSEEESCAEAQVTVAVDRNGRCVAVHKSGGYTHIQYSMTPTAAFVGTYLFAICVCVGMASIDPTGLLQVLKDASRVGVELIKKLEAAMAKLGTGQPVVRERLGFMAA